MSRDDADAGKASVDTSTQGTLFHNPRCSKSRGALELLTERGVTPTIVRYLEQPPQPGELREILRLLGLPARKLLRTGEAEYRELRLDDSSLDEGALIEAMSKHPKLIERPIFVRGDRAVIGRPPERVLELLTPAG
ncbi:MAG TPA: arsenate reductase (glutaredoxin) [Burkholderiaceae bacterium]|nr:arsenate reductase (glutaredoxin) [Burkholderiaceae bacterium]